MSLAGALEILQRYDEAIDMYEAMLARWANSDVVANNLANLETTAFKKDRANFEDLFYRHHVLPGAEDNGGGQTATGTSVGLGTRVSSIQTDFRQGAHKQTDNPFDVAIEGKGFFQVQDTNGDTLLGSWRAEGVKRPEGIATDGTDVWIVDQARDRVFY